MFSLSRHNILQKPWDWRASLGYTRCRRSAKCLWFSIFVGPHRQSTDDKVIESHGKSVALNKIGFNYFIREQQKILKIKFGLKEGRKGKRCGRNLQPVLMKSLSDAARWVFLARQPKATHRAVRMALFPPAPPPQTRRRKSINRQGAGEGWEENRRGS